MDKEEVVRLVDEFFNEKGLFWDFKSWVESRGYTLRELGFPDE